MNYPGVEVQIVTITTVEFHSHGYVMQPFCGYQSDVSRFDWRNQRMFHHGVSIIVSIKNLNKDKGNVGVCFLLKVNERFNFLVQVVLNIYKKVWDVN